MYSERVIPLLYTTQIFFDYFKESVKQLVCRNGGYLWIHCDEMGYGGCYYVKNAKKYAGLNPGAVKIYHKSNISKNIDTYVVRMDFEDILETGGREINIFPQRNKMYKITQRKIFSKNGIIIKQKGHIYKVDFNVTGSNNGT